MHQEVVTMANNLAVHPHTLVGDFICDRLATFVSSKPKLSIIITEDFLRAFTTGTVKAPDANVGNNKHIRIVENLTEAASFSLSRVTVFRSSNFALFTRTMMYQLNPESMSTSGGILGKEWHIANEGPEDCLLIIRVLHWIHQHDQVTVTTLSSRYGELNVTEAGIGTGTRPAECTIKATPGRAQDVLNALKLLKEVEK